jgi:hypothetical protein
MKPSKIKVMPLCRVAVVLVFACAADLAQPSSATLPDGTVDLNAPILQQHASDWHSQNWAMHDDLLKHLVGAEPYATQRGLKTDGLDFEISDDPPSPSPGVMLANVQKAACSADAIMIGSIAAQRSHLTANRTSVYTDYAFAVQQTLKGTPAKQIVLLRIGGKVTGIASGTSLTSVSVSNAQYPTLQPNTTYLIFLDRIAATGAYAAPNPDGAWFANNGQWTFVRKADSMLVLPEFTQGTLENNIANWLKSCQ